MFDWILNTLLQNLIAIFQRQLFAGVLWKAAMENSAKFKFIKQVTLTKNLRNM